MIHSGKQGFNEDDRGAPLIPQAVPVPNVQNMAVQTMAVQVPTNFGPHGGQQLTVETPSGLVTVIVPSGVGPGQIFNMQVPALVQQSPVLAQPLAQPLAQAYQHDNTGRWHDGVLNCCSESCFPWRSQCMYPLAMPRGVCLCSSFQLFPVTAMFATVSVPGRVGPCLMARIAASGTSWSAADLSTTH